MIWITNTQSNLTNQTHRLSQICINPVFSLQPPSRFHILAKISTYPDFSSSSPLISDKPPHSNLFWVTWVSDILSLSIESDLIWLFGYQVGEFWNLDLFSLPFEIRFWVHVAVYIFLLFFPPIKESDHCTNKDRHQHGQNLNPTAWRQFMF